MTDDEPEPLSSEEVIAALCFGLRTRRRLHGLTRRQAVLYTWSEAARLCARVAWERPQA